MARLSETADIFSGVNPDPSPDGECRFLQIRHLLPDSAVYIAARRPTAGRAVPVEDADVLLAARGEYLSAVHARTWHVGAYIALDVYLIRPDLQRLDPDFLVAFLMLPTTGALLRKSTAGASLPRIPKDALTDLEIPLPPLNQQRAIGGLSSTSRRHRELADRLIAAQTKLAEISIERMFAHLN